MSPSPVRADQQAAHTEEAAERPGRSKDLQGMSLLEISHTCSSE